MLHRKTYTIHASRSKDLLERIRLPFIVEKDGFRFTLSKPDEEESRHVATEDCSVSLSQLELRPAEYRDGVLVQSATIEVKGSEVRQSFAHVCTNALSFLLDCPLRMASMGATLVPECEADRNLLDDFGTTAAYAEVTATLLGAGLRYTPTTDAVLWLAQRPVAIALFADAIQHTSSAAQFRELWRVIEAAFGVWREKDLVPLVAGYPPLQRLGVTPDEIRELRSLRGDLSHAWQLKDAEVLGRFNRQAGMRIGRLRSVVECVIRTKHVWGSPDYDHDPDVPTAGYIRADGGIVLYKPSSSGGDLDGPAWSDAPR